MEHGLKLVSLNIERDLHYDTALPFLAKEQADVVCLQEILDRDVERFKKELGMDGSYVSIAKADKGRQTEELAREGVQSGTAIFTRLARQGDGVFYYYGNAEHVPRASDPLPKGRHDHSRGAVLWTRVQDGEESFTVATTHFTWTPEGHIVSSAQRQDVGILLEKLAEFPDVVLCGDFNAPRGLEIWERIAARYTDNIPAEYQTSIDQELHEKRGIMYVVDGLFTSPHYRCTNTLLQCGVSDHCAVVSVVERVG